MHDDQFKPVTKRRGPRPKRTPGGREMRFQFTRRDILAVPITHTATSWGGGRDRLFNTYVGDPFGQNGGSYYCGWMWPDSYGTGGSVACAIEL